MKIATLVKMGKYVRQWTPPPGVSYVVMIDMQKEALVLTMAVCRVVSQTKITKAKNKKQLRNAVKRTLRSLEQSHAQSHGGMQAFGPAPNSNVADQILADFDQQTPAPAQETKGDS